MNKGISLFNESISDSIVKNKKYLLKHPSYLVAFSKIIRNIKHQNQIRNQIYEADKLIVPPILIISITSDCNLKCIGCYACNKESITSDELSIGDISRIIDEAVDLGVSMILIAGGEPLLKDGILDIPKKHKNTIFVMFTNGMLISDEIVSQIKSIKNLIPTLSLEGNKAHTDKRRGTGVYEKVLKTMDKLNMAEIMYGASITLTCENYDSVIRSKYLRFLEDSGSAITFLIEYVPQDKNDTLYLSLRQKNDLIKRCETFQKEYNMLVVALPGDEEKYDGCLAAGRGFVHINSNGSLEACPFAPYSDINVKNTSLREALKSRLLEEIRNHHDELKETKGGCALNENKEWVKKLTEKY